MTHDEYTALVAEGRYDELPGPIVPKGSVYVDPNGTIENILLKPATSFAVIRSKKGALRANHWHKTDWHYIHVISGNLYYFEGPAKEGYRLIARPSDTIFTPPNRLHAVLSLTTGIFVTMALKVRSHEEHEADVVREELISRKRADWFVEEYEKTFGAA